MSSETSDSVVASVASLTLGCPFTKDDIVRLVTDPELGLRAQDLVMRSPHTTYRGALYAGGTALSQLNESSVDEIFHAIRTATDDVGCETQHDPFGPYFSQTHDGYVVTYAIRPQEALALQLQTVENPGVELRGQIFQRAIRNLRRLDIWPLLEVGELAVALEIEAIWVPSDRIGPLDLLWE